ncbi:hypothetical protein [Blastococcus goldschmidtiae]|uniref:SUKH-4 immunity protein of toxin-antitoxin system n=1 Tax=Blastococcus goldschmidtiae TaxID=3075546 RepID=A0ABU2KAP8_9ACTN|nr:hypothetical protein [Blastococcus sp. DSM 46792]MDT0277266.1 hypothetical protein [Blastococcus sp. DSM 46792]
MQQRVVALGAECDLLTEQEARAELLAQAPPADAPATVGWAPYVPVPEVLVLDPRAVSFRVAEFADLSDGRRIRLHAERGFTIGGGPDPWAGLTLDQLTDDVLNTVLPDDAEDTGEDHPWSWLAELLRVQGVDAGPEDLRGLPYAVEFSNRLRARVLDRP